MKAMDDKKWERKHIFRSLRMIKCELILYTEIGYHCMMELGRNGMVQFIPTINPEDECMVFAQQVHRCADLLRIIDFAERQVKEFKLNIVFYPDVEEEYPPEPGDLARYENDLHELHAELKEIYDHIIELRRHKEYHEEKAKALMAADKFILSKDERLSLGWSDSETELRFYHINPDLPHHKVGICMGTIQTQKFYAFERVIFRTFHSHCVMFNAQILCSRHPMMKPKRMERRTAFVVFYLGQKVGERLLKICTGNQAMLFDCPLTFSARQEQIQQALQQEKHYEELHNAAEEDRRRCLNVIAADLFIWKFNTLKMMTIYAELNKMKLVEDALVPKYLTSYVWLPEHSYQEVKKNLMLSALRSARGTTWDSSFPPILTVVKYESYDMPPSHFDLDFFMSGFQALIDAYGVANYGELNPTPFAVVTFPFLFAVMFGDVGHGIILTLFALVLIGQNNRYLEAMRRKGTHNDIGDILFKGRYVILLMGMMSIYTGLIYNDMFAKPLSLFSSHWAVDRASLGKTSVRLDPQNPEHCDSSPYYFGMDPIWKLSGDDGIITFNSVKMKLAIIFGVLHMTLGLLLSAINQLHFKSYVELLLVTIPQVIIFCSLFIYLIVLIFIKWVNYGGHMQPPHNSACAPSILITFINMVLLKKTVPVEGCETYMYENQDAVQKMLLMLVIIFIPILLIGKPIYFHVRQYRKRRELEDARMRALEERYGHFRELMKHLDPQTMSKRDSSLTTWAELVKQEEVIDMLEVWIHSGIHCVDSVLGGISHTASYLRLWALSLAHGELSHVLWQMVLQYGFGDKYYYSVILFGTFAVWAALTIVIMVVMEGLSAFLHTLRLHWVEFQSKFYAGNGAVFTPFRFKKPSKYI